MSGNSAAYMREYRARHPEYREKHRVGVRARKRALERLADLHPDEFNDLLDEERINRGLEALGMSKMGRPAGKPVHSSDGDRLEQ